MTKKKKHVFDRMIENYSKRWFKAIGKRVFPALVYSGFCQSFQIHEIPMNRQRFRLHILLLWGHGLYKSTIISETVRLFGLKSNVLTTASAAAMRGSFTEKAFVPPEFLISDIILFPELSVILGGDKEMLGQLMAAMEESDMRIALVKIGTVSQKVLSQVRKFGADVEDSRLIYRNKATIISATHSVDQIPESNREAFLSRQYLVQISPVEVPDGLGWKEQSDFLDTDLYEEFADWFQERYALKEKPDIEFGRKAIKLLKKSFEASPMNPDSRQINDIRKMIYARHGLFPDETEDQVIMNIRPFVTDQEGKTTRDKLVELILSNPQTMKDITKYVGMSKSAFYAQKKRLGIKSMSNTSPMKYYLDSIPAMNKHGGKRVKGQKSKSTTTKRPIRVVAPPKPKPMKKTIVKKKTSVKKKTTVKKTTAKKKSTTAKKTKRPVGRPKKKPRGFAITAEKKKAEKKKSGKT